MNIHQTSAHARFLQSIGWIIESRNSINAFIRPIPLTPFSVLKLQRVPLEFDWTWVHSLENKYRVIQTNIELNETFPKPQNQNPILLKLGYKPVKDFMLNTKTRILDLSKSEASLLKDMKPKTRYNIHLAEKHQLQTRLWTCDTVVADQSLFNQIYGLLKANARRINMLLLPKNWIFNQFAAYSSTGFVIGVSKSSTSELSAVATFYCSDTTCSYNLNGSTSEGRIHMAPTLAVWTGIKHAKKLGFQDFDFDGVFDERFPKTQKRFQGFGRFKAGFGGQEVYFYPMHKKWHSPFNHKKS